MEMTTAAFFTRLVYDIDADDVHRELESVSVKRRQEVWEKALEHLGSEGEAKRYRVLYLVQVLGTLSKDYEGPLRHKTKEALKAIENANENDRRSIQRILAQIEHREENMMSFRRYEALARLVKYGNLYKIKDDREFTSWSPKGEDVPLSFTNEETVEWLVDRGLAHGGDYDPALCLGKVLPTEKAADRLENHGLTLESFGVGAHIGHCCLTGIHGCKYGDEFCPVVTKMFPPESERCGACYEDDYMTDEELGHYTDLELAGELQHRGYTVIAPKDNADAED